jgi:gamma-glutamylcyclotransferase
MALDLSTTTLYFGYGSNLWKHQMQQRCPTSNYLGIARLNNYRWIINSRGYANVVELPTSSSTTVEPEAYKDEVWGLIYSLEAKDESNLDKNEGVPTAYTKEDLDIDFWPAQADGKKPDVSQKPKEVAALVYINRKLVTPDKPKKEYIYRMNMGIKDAVDEGVPGKYVEKVMRRFIPEQHEEEIVEVARRQALVFEDEV